MQVVASAAIAARTGSEVLTAFGLDAALSGFSALILAFHIHRFGPASARGIGERSLQRMVAYGYMAAALLMGFLGGTALWTGEQPGGGVLGVAVAALSMLMIPIIGSYMKTLAVELRSQMLKAAAVFTFGNSYLSMVLLVGLLVQSGMDYWWGDPLGAIVMAPFVAQKGIQIILDEDRREYVED